MSFGFSVSDFIAAIKLASRIQKEFVDAPKQFKDISDGTDNDSLPRNPRTDPKLEQTNGRLGSRVEVKRRQCQPRPACRAPTPPARGKEQS
jgi:hypothetical protein